MNAQLDLPLLKTLLLGSEVVNISVGDVVGLAEESGSSLDDVLRQVVQSFVVVSDKPCVQDVIVVLTVVESDKSELDKLLYLSSRRVDEFYRSYVSFRLVHHYEEIRENLDVVKHKRLFGGDRIGRLLRLELHLRQLLNTIIRVMRAFCRKYQYVVSHIAYVILKT